MNVKTGFDVERLIATSKKLEMSDIVWEDIPKYPLTESEVRTLTYMMDVESYTLVFLKELLTDAAMKDDELAGFLSVWGYEEYFHGWSLKKFLRAYGVEVADGRGGEVVQAERDWRYHVRYAGQQLVTKLAGKHFLGVHMAGGAINELVTAQAYKCVAHRTQHPILHKLLVRIMRDERRHYSFYAQQAVKRLQDPVTRKFTTFVINNFLDPVGKNLRPDAEVAFGGMFIFGDDYGAEAVRQVDATFGRIPGFEGTRWFETSLAKINVLISNDDLATVKRDLAFLAQFSADPLRADDRLELAESPLA